ncbi:MAG TPA: efflux RND transporter permease subunit, partial [Luteolibacter sp.]|nr:efflux RND transporter permease subunit [Luteolibacter sp.]
MIRWFARNDIAANFLVVGILLWGGYSFVERVPLEVQPSVEFQRVDVTVIYRGGSPADVEKQVVIPIENSLIGLHGIESIVAEARSGDARIRVYTDGKTSTRNLMEDIKTRISRITTLPPETEPPEIRIPDTTLWFDVIKVAITGDMDQQDLLKATLRVRDDLIDLPEISQVFLQGDSPHEIAVEIDPESLRDYNLTFAELSEAIRRSSLDLPAGNILTDEGSLTIRSKGQAYDRDDFQRIVIRNRDGAQIKLGDIAKITDGFEGKGKILRFNGKPALLVEALRLNDENALDVAAAVKRYVANSHERFPEGITLYIWDDSTVELEGRLGSMLQSLCFGGLLVMIVLGLFLRPSIALWVTLGIPVSFAGGFIVMPWLGMTANVMSIFGFIIVIGIIVDDAIVTAENVYIHLQNGVEPLEAVTVGTKEVAVPVTFGALTTIVAFIPLLFFDGFYGSFTKQIPPIVTAVLLFSLLESKLCLPSHLKHVRIHRGPGGPFARFQLKIAHGLQRFVEHCYEPTLRLALRHRYSTLAGFLAVALACFGYIRSGAMGFVNMPSIDRNRIIADLRMHRDTPIEVTQERVQQVAAAVERLREEFIDPGTGRSIINDVLTSSGGWPAHPGSSPSVGFVVVSVTDPGQRTEPGPRNREIAKRWTELVGEMPDVQSFSISGDRGGGFRGDRSNEPVVAVELRGPESAFKRRVADQVTNILKNYNGIAEVKTNSSGIRDELLVTLRPEGEALGLTQRELARQVRGAFFGEQAQRILRDRDDVRVMVRLPEEQRNSLQTLEGMRIRTPSGGEAPFHSVATATFARGQSYIERVDGAQTITLTAEPVDETVDAVAISRDLAPRINELIGDHSELSWRYTGYVAEHEQTRQRTILGGILLFVALYALLAIPFQSLYQPLFVMLAIPFGMIGALAGHLVMDITPSYLSIFGILALAGVAVNDSLVMVDYINQKVRAGENLFEAVIQSGTRRFR